jgi:hypothetical protein
MAVPGLDHKDRDFPIRASAFPRTAGGAVTRKERASGSRMVVPGADSGKLVR